MPLIGSILFGPQVRLQDPGRATGRPAGSFSLVRLGGAGRER
jgi:hypothetical protein